MAQSAQKRSRMDYCSSCRRTLNGALVCPGCGAYAPDIAPPGYQGRGAAPAAPATPEAWRGRGFPVAADYFGPASRLGAESTAHSEISEQPVADAADGSDDGSAGAPAGDSEYAVPAAAAASAIPVTEGRAARRRELARWKKQRRRAVVASTVALVGGGLTLAVLPSRPSTGHDAQASAAPEPHAAATSLADATDTDSSTVRPRTGDPQGSATRTQPSAISSPPRNATTAVTTTATKRLQQTTVAARPTATTSPQARTAPVANVPIDEAPATADPTPPPQQTTTPPPPPPPTDDSTAETPPPSPPPTAEERDRLCLLVICLG
ncbi:hypothetical protein ACFXCZ_03945 [Streptomyces sp. NPDC059396]|uniref:SCO2400 family protein n=1 Tax=Streptomyces sp. NPDC059396 TaxID=3346819 RepID=UPI0036C49DCB